MNHPDPLIGVILHAIGGLASASFYLPFRSVKGWAWESYWLVGGVFSWVVSPWIFALIQTPALFRVLAVAPPSAVFWTYFFGVLWGIGGLTFGLTMRYLGIALGMAMALGYCAAFGTLMPPLFRGELEGVARTTAGATVLFGVFGRRWRYGAAGRMNPSRQAETTLAERYAQGDIDEVEYRKRLEVLLEQGAEYVLLICETDRPEMLRAFAAEVMPRVERSATRRAERTPRRGSRAAPR